MSIFDWLGPLNAGKAPAGWDRLPIVRERKSSPPIQPAPVAFTARTLATTIGSLPNAALSIRSGSGNSAVFACLQAIATAVAEPELEVYDVSGGDRIEVEDSPLGALLASPNPIYTLDTLLAYASVCLHVDGNAYWRKLRSAGGNVVALWPISPSRVQVFTEQGSTDFISYYRYWLSPGGQEQIPPADMVHFRLGLNDVDHRVGVSPLRQLLREVSSDEQATRYADRLLANLAINGLTLSFDKEAPPITQDQADELKARISGAYGGDNVGGAAVLSPGAQLTALGFSPEQMDMKTLHRVPEERISAVLGVPAIVAGLGAGLDHATYSNVAQAREAFTEMKLIPLWRALAAQITLQLVPDFDSSGRLVVDFDTSEVRALSVDQDALAVRLKTLVETGIISVDEARAELGLEPRGGADAIPAVAATPAPATQPAAASARPTLITLSARRETTRGGGEAEGPRRSLKAAEDLPGRYADLRESALPDWTDELEAFFAAQLRRVQRRLRAGADHADALVPETEALRLAAMLRPLQLDVLDLTHGLVVAELGVAFGLDDPQTRAFLRAAGINVVGITDTTREQVRAELVAGQQQGEGIPELARRLRGLPAFTQARAETVARSELGTSQNAAALASYRASGVVVGVRVHDGEDFDAACAAMDGRVFPLGQEPASLQHPNCVRAFAPVTDAAELTRSA
ncbi:MAG TPA: phage portal protein [Terriglobales bacterium]|nr:phage portal protein [Terriglobales bacterium]